MFPLKRRTPPTLAWLWRQLRAHGALCLVVVALVLLGGYYARSTPLFEVTDEPWHYLRVENVAGDRFSPALAELRAAWRPLELADEPPLYYELGSYIVRTVPILEDDTPYAPNPWAVLGDTHSTGNRNAVLHLSAETPPYAGVALAVQRLRTFSLICTVGSILLLYATVRCLLPERREVALGAAALAAFTPGMLVQAATASNAAWTLLAISATLYFASRIYREGGDYRLALAAGAAAGVAALSGRAGAPALLLVPAAYLAHRTEPEPVPGRWLRWAALGLLAAVTCGGWWVLARVGGADFWRAEPLSYRIALKPAQGGLLAAIAELLASYWGSFGWGNVPAEPWFYSLIGALSLVSLGGGLVLVLRSRWLGQPSAAAVIVASVQRPGRLVVPVIWMLLVALQALWRTHLRFWPQGALFHAAIGPVSLMLVLGILAWARPRRRGWLAGALALLLAGISALAPHAFIAPHYALPERLTLSGTPADMQELDLSFGDDLYLLGYDLPQDSVTAGSTVRLRLYWVSRKRIARDYTFSVFALGRGGALVGTVNGYPGAGNLPTRRWLPGEVVVDEYRVPVDAAAQAPSAGSLRVSVYHRPGDAAIHASELSGQDAGSSPQIAALRIELPYQVIYEPDIPADVRFGGRVRLLGYSLSPLNPTSGEEWQVRLVWQAVRRMSFDYTVFVHLVDERGKLLAQADQQPLGGDYPSSFWRPGEQVLDTHTLRVPKMAPSGAYWFRVGWYLLDSGERLAVDSSTPPTDFVVLGPAYVDVTASEGVAP